MKDEGLARNINKIFGNSTYQLMGNKILESVTLSDDKTIVTFLYADGEVIKLKAEGDCCSVSWIEHLELPNEVKGQKMVDVQDYKVREEDLNGGDVRQFYQTVFRTDKGETIKIEYRNDSNGYYGGYLERVK